MARIQPTSWSRTAKRLRRQCGRNTESRQAHQWCNGHRRLVHRIIAHGDCQAQFNDLSEHNVLKLAVPSFSGAYISRVRGVSHGAGAETSNAGTIRTTMRIQMRKIPTATATITANTMPSSSKAKRTANGPGLAI